MSILRIFFVYVLGALAFIGITENAQALDSRASNSLVNASGNFSVPENYRSNYEFLGDWAVAADEASGSKEKHTVYASPGTTSSFLENGRFPDGAVLVKEVFETSTSEMTTGTVSHSKKLVGWFVMIKGSNNSYPANKLWGDGWGWSWFDSSDPIKTTSSDYESDCLSCHMPARETDWIYTQGYPVLKR